MDGRWYKWPLPFTVHHTKSSHFCGKGFCTGFVYWILDFLILPCHRDTINDFYVSCRLMDQMDWKHSIHTLCPWREIKLNPDVHSATICTRDVGMVRVCLSLSLFLYIKCMAHGAWCRWRMENLLDGEMLVLCFTCHLACSEKHLPFAT